MQALLKEIKYNFFYVYFGPFLKTFSLGFTVSCFAKKKKSRSLNFTNNFPHLKYYVEFFSYSILKVPIVILHFIVSKKYNLSYKIGLLSYNCTNVTKFYFFYFIFFQTRESGMFIT